MASIRTCKACGDTFEAENGSRGQWPRYCSEACRTAPRRRQQVTATCSVADCTNLARSNRAEACEMHYYRLRRRGTLDAQAWHRRDKPCAADGCDQAELRFGYCSKHAARVQRHGDPLVVLAPAHHVGPENTSWLGDAAGYSAVHARIVVRQGFARDHQCIDCNAPAAHWSYDHTDPDEKRGEHGPYSHDLDCYSPRCVSCHKVLDLDFTRSRAVG